MKQMRLFHFHPTFMLLLLLAACKDKGDGTVQVSGVLRNNPERQSVYLQLVEMGSAAPQSMDTVVIEPGEARFKLSGGAAGKEDMYVLRFERDRNFIVLVNDVDRISFQADWNSMAAYTTNSPNSNSMRGLLKGFNDRLVGLDSLRNQVVSLQSSQGTDSLLAVREGEFNASVGKIEDYLVGYADTAKSATVALYALGLAKGQIGTEKLKPVMLNLARKFSDKPEVTRITTEFFQFVQKEESRSASGGLAPDFTLPDPSGKSISLSSFRGKYVLVDFWASWCGPCRQENPNVVDAYQRFKDKNFTILGVSLDKSRDAWLEAIKNDRLDWTHVSDLKFWESMVVPLYQIEGIPFNVLLDPQGKIIASNLRGKQLSDKLEKILK